jgi:DNA-binding NtrC family response regulator
LYSRHIFSRDDSNRRQHLQAIQPKEVSKKSNRVYTEQPMTDSIQNRGKAGRILVVDDEKQICEIIRTMLEAANYECREAGSGPEALVLLESGDEFDLMLSNLLMPDLDGIGLLERTKDKYPDMPVVMVTGVHDVTLVLAAIRKGAHDYLLKPFEPEQLLDTVSRALESRRLKMERREHVSSLESRVAALLEQLRGRKS